MPLAPRSRRRRPAIHLIAAISVLATAPFWTATAGAQTATLADIATRDQLIFNQEALLNVYRCRFDIDILIVPGGCVDGQPAEPAAEPAPFAGTPNASEVYARDSLIASQESLLNTYRCRFDIDTQIVPGGCVNGQPAEPSTAPMETTASTTIASGFSHSCAIRADDTIACWGNNGHGQSNPPPGQYTSVTTGDQHSCALGADNTIACWGNNGTGQSDPPPGRFTAVSAGNVYSCGIRTDNTIACWGDNKRGQANAPSGQFTAIAVGTGHSCAIATDNTITCWGWDGDADAPLGLFTAIAATAYHSCALGIDNTVTCWGSNENGQTDAPPGLFAAVAAGFSHSCAIRADGTIACWGPDSPTDPPAGQFMVGLPSASGPADSA